MPDKEQYEVIREGEDIIIRIEREEHIGAPSVEDDGKIMSQVIDILKEVKTATKIVFFQKRNYEYDYDQTILLSEIATLHNKIIREELIKYHGFIKPGCERYANSRYMELQNLIYHLMKSDPLGTYVELRRTEREQHLRSEKMAGARCQEIETKFLETLKHLIEIIGETRLVQIAMPYLRGYKLGDRSVYQRIFAPTIKPDFMYTKLMSTYPTDGIELDSYVVNDTEVTVFGFDDDIQTLYHIVPPEFRLTEDKYEILDTARTIMAEHKPKRSEFVDPKRMREVFFNVGHDLIEELLNHRGLKMNDDEVKQLAEILVRYTVGFGLIEVLLQDEKVQDISVNSPLGNIPLFIVHQDFDDCKTNILPTVREAESWASKLRMISGRPLDEANPLLDTEMELPGASTRVSTITYPLDPSGLAFSFRRHRDKPWTLPLFIKVGMITPLAAGLLSFLVDGTRTMLICGTRSSGKSSFLSSLLIEIMRRYRIITVEDSISGDSKVLTIADNTLLYDSVENIFKQHKKNLLIPSISKNGRFSWKNATKLIRHKVNKPMYKVVTRTGRKLKITGDHSIFCLGNPTLLMEEKISNLHIGDKIAVPRRLPIPEVKFDFYSKLKEHPERIYLYFKESSLQRYRKNILSLKAPKQNKFRWIRSNYLPLAMAKEIDISSKDITSLKYGHNSIPLPFNIKFDKKFLEFLGLWIADGCFDKKSVIFSVSSKEERELVKQIANRLSFSVKRHTDNFSLMIHSSTLKHLIGKTFGFAGNAYTKKIPAWIMGLKDELRAAFLRGLFSGDGCVSDKEIIVSLASDSLLHDIQTLLLNWGISLRINRKRKKKPNDRTRDSRISTQESILLFKKHIGFLQSAKTKKLQTLSKRVSTHASSDTIKLDNATLTKLSELCPRRIFNSQDYIKRGNGIGTKKLNTIANYLKNHKLGRYLRNIADSDILWDEITYIKRLDDKPQYVYDFSVPGNESFIANNILAHNTLELPTTPMRKLGFNIQPMKVAPALAAASSEMSASDGIRATLRLGDSALIVGEVRSKEATALYEAMRVGAAANVVAGTIHGDSPYGIYDRVVNDIGVPKTSFKATDICIIANPVRSADGLHKYRRVTQITEVRKDWEEDPLAEGAFVDLMKYNAQTDQLEPSKELLNGDSEILKAIAGNIKEFAGNWDALWDNILLRAKIKEAQLNFVTETGNDELLEAEFTIKCNDAFHKITEKVREELGSINSDRIYQEWETWLKRELKKESMK